MARKLLIVESPAKARTIAKILGRDFHVRASVGHVRDLPKNTLGVDEDADFEPQYQVLPDKIKIVAELQKVARSADEIFLATDPDREGEAICWHLFELLKDVQSNLHRVEFHEITRRAVEQAFTQPRAVDMSRVDAQQARRVIDRLVGYRLSPLLWDKVKRGLSAGRVQSVALKMICDREAEIEAFVPQEYWLVDAVVAAGEPPPFALRLSKKKGRKWRPTNETEAREVESALRSNDLKLAQVNRRTRRQSPKPPYITSHLQQEASRRLRFPVRRTMQVAQRLYEGVDLGPRGLTGLITYMRTDSVRVSDESVTAARELIGERFGVSALPPAVRQFKNKSSAQDAHEAIRPTDPTLTPDDVAPFLKSDELRLYRLVWERFVASQMSDAVFDLTQVELVVDEFVLATTGKVLTDPGFLRLWVEEEDDQSETSGALPPGLAPGHELSLREVKLEQKSTQPPPRFSEATLVKALEENGIGRPSTYASIIATLGSRDYTAREKSSFRPTELGKLVNRLLVASFSRIINETYTAKLEEALDEIAAGRTPWKTLVRDFSASFAGDLEAARAHMEQVKGRGVPTDLRCPDCNAQLVMKFGRFGEFLACSAYPQCRYTRNLDENTEAPPEQPEEAPTCPECHAEMTLKRSRYGPFWACSRYPECRGTRRLGGETSAAPKGTGVGCPNDDCDGEIVERKSRRGKVFYGCSRYPRCQFSMWDPPQEQGCPECGFPVLGLRETKRRGRELVCPNRNCGFRQAVANDGENEG